MRSAVNSKIYVDKTGLLNVLNRAIDTEKRCFAVSRARRFGKSLSCGMIDAYYSRGADSKELLMPFEIARSQDFEKYLNKFNVLHFDVATHFNAAKRHEDIIPRMDGALLQEMLEEFPYLKEKKPESASHAMHLVYKEDLVKFIVIIDEYDCIIREAPEDDALILQYLRYIRGFFKTEESKRFLALGYITGILPIKKIKGESALNNFSEYTMADSAELTTFFGFTQGEVDDLCEKYDEKSSLMREWYDGYYMYAADPDEKTEAGEEGTDGSVRIIGEKPLRLWHIYNPNSVTEMIGRGMYKSFWKNTGSFSSLQDLISLDYAGLKEDVKRMLIGERRKVNIDNFQNDLNQFKRKDDVIACLIHMGYLGYDAFRKEAFIPNREVAEVFESAVETGDWADLADSLNNSRAFLQAIWDKDEGKVAEMIAASHQDYASIINFHDENSLAAAIMMSAYAARADYRVIREFPSGRGFADIAFIPKREGAHPAMIIELKWNRSAKAALKQIKDKEYAGALARYHGTVLLIGINYTKKSNKYTCKISQMG